MDTIKAIMERRSTRGFSDAPLTENEIKTLVDAALASPSAMNRQPWHFAFVTDKMLLDEFESAMAQITGSSDRKVLYGAPVFVVITFDPAQEHKFTKVDCGIAVENLALAAFDMGLGSVILGMPAEVFSSDKASYFKEKMGIPASNEFAVGIVIGRNTVTKDAHPILNNRYSIH